MLHYAVEECCWVLLHLSEEPLNLHICIHIGQAQKVPVADFFRAIQEVPDWQTQALWKDRLHLSGKGNQVLFDTVMATIKKTMPTISPIALQAEVQFMSSIPVAM